MSPNSEMLKREDGTTTVGMTDLSNHKIYISNNIHGLFLRKVICHEITHAYCMSKKIYIPYKYEEYFCDLVATFGSDIVELSKCICDNLCKC